MREKQTRIVVTFFTTAEAMAMERLAKQRGIEGKLISAPRSLSADCGIAWSSPESLETDLREAIAHKKLETQGIHKMLV